MEFTITCPHCGTEFICEPGGISLHCYDYKIKGGGMLVGDLETHTLTCPVCKEEFKDK